MQDLNSNLRQLYESGHSLREISEFNGVAIETVRRKLMKEGVEMRPLGSHKPPRLRLADARMPACGVPPKVLYYQGNCSKCSVAMYAREEKSREICGYCEKKND